MADSQAAEDVSKTSHDRLIRGDLSHIPTEASSVVRVFISSTFSGNGFSLLEFLCDKCFVLDLLTLNYDKILSGVQITGVAFIISLAQLASFSITEMSPKQ